MNRFPLLIIVLFLFSCTTKTSKNTVMDLSAAAFDTLINGKKTALYTLSNERGMRVSVTNYGAKIVSIVVPGKDGEPADVVLGFASVADYVKYGASHGATVGPFANRISGAAFTIGSDTFRLPVNNGPNCIHSGPESFYRQVWEAHQQDNHVVMTLHSPDGEWGFPGNKTVTVTYTLTPENELRIDYNAVSDKPTHFNLTNHSYFNLRGEGNGDILDHVVVIMAGEVTPVDSFMIPTGEIKDIRGSSLDFTTPHPIGERIDREDPQLQIASGYDFNYILGQGSPEPVFAASAWEPGSGRYMEVLTTEPGIQLYTGNHLKGTEVGKRGVAYSRRTGFCFETQHFPDSPHQPQFPTTLLLPGDTLRSTTIYRFSIK